MSRFLFHFALFTSIAVMLASCNEPALKQDVQQKQVEAFSDKIEAGFAAGKVGVLDLHFDRQAFVDRVTNDVYWDQRLEDIGNTSYKAEYRQQLMQEMTLAGMFLAGIDGTSYFTYDAVKQYQIDGKWHAVFRMFANDAINYHDMILRVDTNKVWIEDVYVITVGSRLSEIMKESYISGIPSANSVQRQSDQQKLVNCRVWMNSQAYEKALAAFDSISSDYSSQKSMRLFRLQILANIANQEYVRELERFETDFPNEAGTVLMQMDKNFLYGNYPEAIENINKLRSMFGEDPVLDYYHANALNLLGKCDEAAPKYRLVLATKTDWELPLVNWMNCLIKAGKNEEAVNLIRTYQSDFSFTPTYVKYLFNKQPGFLNSSAFNAWENEQNEAP